MQLAHMKKEEKHTYIWAITAEEGKKNDNKKQEANVKKPKNINYTHIEHREHTDIHNKTKHDKNKMQRENDNNHS